MLEKVPAITDGLTDDRKKQLLAEAHFLRALAHFYAARIWGDIPVNLEARNVKPLGKEPLNDVMRMVVDEANIAIPDLLKRGTIKESMSRGTKGAALAMKAHALMWLKDYQGASDAMKEIISSNTFKLVPIEQFRALFRENLKK